MNRGKERILVDEKEGKLKKKRELVKNTYFYWNNEKERIKSNLWIWKRLLERIPLR